jgi:hypothetical protein
MSRGDFCVKFDPMDSPSKLDNSDCSYLVHRFLLVFFRMRSLSSYSEKQPRTFGILRSTQLSTEKTQTGSAAKPANPDVVADLAGHELFRVRMPG